MPDMWMDVDAGVIVPVNVAPLIDDTDFKSIEDNSVAYNATGLELIWHFYTSAGAGSHTAVTPTTSGVYDWTHGDGGVYQIEIPASGGGTINNDTEGVGWFTGKATGVLPWRGPTIGFRASGLNDALIDNAWSTTRGLAGTALPAAAADAAGGLIISDDGGLDIDTVRDNVAAILADTGTDGVVLANDAITSAKFDESTAFPLGAADAGATAVARVGADSDTLETLSDQLDAIVADTNELQGDWANGGRLDNILDARASQTSVDTVDGIVDSILADTGTDGVVVAAGSKTGYALDSAYDAAKTAATQTSVDENAAAIAEVLAQTKDIAVTGQALTVVPGSFTKTYGTETGTYENTLLADGTYHRIAAENAGSNPYNIDGYYEFDIGAEGVPVEVSLLGHLIEGSLPYGGDSVDVYAYNWGVGWDHVSPPSGDFIGSGSSTDVAKTMALLARHVGTGDDEGLVRIRVAGTSLESGTELYIDQILVRYAIPLSVTAVWAGAQPMNLADDAITAAKFDESTAFPLAASDAGATAVARVGADSDTLETLSDQLDAIVADTNEVQTKLANMIEADGADWRYKANALENSPTGTGGFTSDDRDVVEETNTLVKALL